MNGLNAVDNATVFRFIKKLSTPFKKWRAFKHGIIDEHGNILKKREDLDSRNEKDAFTRFDLLVLNVKKAMGKIPGGETRMASYAAALYLIKEHAAAMNEDVTDDHIHQISESISESRLEAYFVEDVPANHTSTSSIAGLGSDAISPKIHNPIMTRHKKEATKTKEKLKDE